MGTYIKTPSQVARIVQLKLSMDINPKFRCSAISILCHASNPEAYTLRTCFLPMRARIVASRSWLGWTSMTEWWLVFELDPSIWRISTSIFALGLAKDEREAVVAFYVGHWSKQW